MTNTILEPMEERRQYKNKDTVKYEELHKRVVRSIKEAEERWIQEKCNEIEILQAKHDSFNIQLKIKECIKNGVLTERWKQYMEELFGDGTFDNVTAVVVLITPDMQPVKNKARKQAIHFLAQELKRDIFKDISKKETTTSSKKLNKSQTTSSHKSNKPSKASSRKSAVLPTTSKSAAEEVWICSICDIDCVADMRSCGTWVHEECVGLTKEDKENFICTKCCYSYLHLI
ncbi:unnamed protein product [Ceutorhynchus assimilis]|uniref:Zinc finger PHD-type domain-containing protein n=1 Tax=Ceutorhynchus assimilis TaxID=467358 RepID=A0A9N9MFM6_9CUCU|nr:unnamed protein product [Ceutorhynchus assimilis]